MTNPEQNPLVHFVTLGCPKNRVDSELMLGQLQDREMTFTMDAEEADVIVVNTCGFIEDAKKESIDVILEMARHRTEGRAKKLIVTGCLVQRYANELSKEIPEIDALYGNGAYDAVATYAEAEGAEKVVDVSEPKFIHQATNPRINTFRPHTAYVKVSEGCDQKCTFCIIPSLRGLQRSRAVDDVVLEAKALAARGVVELNLVAQDLTGYGTDLENKTRLADLLEALDEVEGLRWIRLHYAYPRPFPKRLLEAIGRGKVLPYVDMPLQHISDPILKRMRRGRPRAFVEKLLHQLRDEVDDLTLRSSFIVGFPGETDADFEELCQFVKDADFSHVGVFKFSREEGTPSHDLDGQVPQALIDERHDHLMGILKELSNAKMSTFMGRKLEVLIDGISEETELLRAGRHKGQAPEIDGTTYINDGPGKTGDLAEVEITETFDYDIVGHVTKILAPAPERPNHARMEARPALRVLPS